MSRVQASYSPSCLPLVPSSSIYLFVAVVTRLVGSHGKGGGDARNAPSRCGSPVAGLLLCAIRHARCSCTYVSAFIFFVRFGSWMDSAIFDDDMFGRAMGSAENSYQLTEGRFGSIASVLDADHTFLEDIDLNHNAYGYLSPSFNYQVGEKCCFCSAVLSRAFPLAYVDRVAFWKMGAPNRLPL